MECLAGSWKCRFWELSRAHPDMQYIFNLILGGLEASSVAILNNNWKNLISYIVYTSTSLITSVPQGYLCFKLKQFYVNRSQGLVGTVVNWRCMPSLKRKAIHSTPEVYCLAQCREIFLFKKNWKFRFYVTSPTFKYWQLITLKVCKTALCQPNKMLLWKDFSEDHQCGRVGPGLPTPTMLFLLFHSTFN